MYACIQGAVFVAFCICLGLILTSQTAVESVTYALSLSGGTHSDQWPGVGGCLLALAMCQVDLMF